MDPAVEIDSCDYLFLKELSEIDQNVLRVVVAEGLLVGQPQSVYVRSVQVPECTRIDITETSRVYELVWHSYVGYSVRNESFVQFGAEEAFEGRRFRVYSKSDFADYLKKTTFAEFVLQKPTRHYGVACESHIIDVIAF
jgi:hypothetical protein